MTSIDILQDFKTRMIDYLKLKVEQSDWHGVADAAMDIREIDAKIALIQEYEEKGKIEVKSPYLPDTNKEHVNTSMTKYAKKLRDSPVAEFIKNKYEVK